MLDVLKVKPEIVKEAQKAKFQPNLPLQIIIFIGVFFVTQLISAIPMIIALFSRMFVDLSKGKVNVNTFDPEYINSIMKDFTLLALFCTVFVTILTIIYCRFIEKRSLKSMGFVKKNAVKDYVIGMVVGLLMFGTSVLVAFFSGSLNFNGIVIGNSIGIILVYLVAFLFQGMSEEVMMRGYFMVSIATKKPIILAILLNSSLFALMHAANSGVSVIAFINIFLIGIFASIYVLKTNSIWGACALHSIWNFTQGNIFGIKVSGIDVQHSVLSFSSTKSNTIINGGSFGLEGGLAVTIVLIVSIILLLLIKTRTKGGGNYN